MNAGKTVFAQLMSLLPWYEFDKCVKKYSGNYKVQSFTCRQQFLVMSFAQLTRRESLRDIEACINAMPEKLYHSGIRSKVRKSTLADANEKRNYLIYVDFAQSLISTARELYQTENDFTIELDNIAYALDSTTIELCLSMFPWAYYRKKKGAVKAHVLLDFRGSIPTFMMITDGLYHDVNLLDVLDIEPGAFYVMDRGYTDFERLFWLNKQACFFVTRAKSNIRFKRITARKVDKSTGLRCDQTIRLTGHYSALNYPDTLRRISYYDMENKKKLIFLTNNFDIPALTVAQLFKERWKIELFFKWIKQHLKIKTFYGTSENAVFTQIWIAVCTYLILAIAKKRFKLDKSLYIISQVLEFCIFEKVHVNELFIDKNILNLMGPDDKQLSLFQL
ncbi:IS4 family transposase [Bacteroidota bacterium]